MWSPQLAIILSGKWKCFVRMLKIFKAQELLKVLIGPRNWIFDTYFGFLLEYPLLIMMFPK